MDRTRSCCRPTLWPTTDEVYSSPSTSLWLQLYPTFEGVSRGRLHKGISFQFVQRTRKLAAWNKRAAPLRVSGPYHPIQLTLVRCRLAFCHPLRHNLQSNMSALQVWASRVRIKLTLIPERFSPQKLTQFEQLSLWPLILKQTTRPPVILRSCPGCRRHTGRLATKPCCYAVRAAVA
jgi:hypothetical protein